MAGTSKLTIFYFNSFYNKTKSGVDITDQMARQYTVKAGARRWPMAVFYNILDLACTIRPIAEERRF